MSGGSFDYTYSTVEQVYKGKMCDKEMNSLLKDFVKILYELEWWKSGDTSEEDYRKAVEHFKKKWSQKRGQNGKRKVCLCRKLGRLTRYP